MKLDIISKNLHNKPTIIFFLVQMILHNEDKEQISNPLPPKFCSTFKPSSQQAQGDTQECKALPSGSCIVRLVMLFHTVTPSKETKAFTESCHCFLLLGDNPSLMSTKTIHRSSYLEYMDSHTPPLNSA